MQSFIVAKCFVQPICYRLQEIAAKLTAVLAIKKREDNHGKAFFKLRSALRCSSDIANCLLFPFAID
jgi:hypothetical protein